MSSILFVCWRRIFFRTKHQMCKEIWPQNCRPMSAAQLYITTSQAVNKTNLLGRNKLNRRHWITKQRRKCDRFETAVHRRSLVIHVRHSAVSNEGAFSERTTVVMSELFEINTWFNNNGSNTRYCHSFVSCKCWFESDSVDS